MDNTKKYFVGRLPGNQHSIGVRLFETDGQIRWTGPQIVYEGEDRVAALEHARSLGQGVLSEYSFEDGKLKISRTNYLEGKSGSFGERFLSGPRPLQSFLGTIQRMLPGTDLATAFSDFSPEELVFLETLEIAESA